MCSVSLSLSIFSLFPQYPFNQGNKAIQYKFLNSSSLNDFDQLYYSFFHIFSLFFSFHNKLYKRPWREKLSSGCASNKGPD